MNGNMAFISPTPCLKGSLSRNSSLAFQASSFGRPLSLRLAPSRRSTIFPLYIFAQETASEPESDSQSATADEPQPEQSTTEPVAEAEAEPAASDGEREGEGEGEGEGESASGGERRRRRRTRSKREVTLPLEELKVGMELEGTVRSVMQYGAFVGGMGTPTDGLLHVSQLAAGYVENVSDVCKVGDAVKVRVLAIDTEKGTFSLTMKTAEEMSARSDGGRQPRGRREDKKKKWETFTFDPEVFVDAKVMSTTDFGAFCQILNEDGTPSQTVPTDGLAHISELANGRVESVSDVVSAGQIVKVRIIAADPDRNRISLSFKDPSDGSEGGSGRDSSKPRSEYADESSNVAADLASAEASQPSFKTAFELAFERANTSGSGKQ